MSDPELLVAVRESVSEALGLGIDEVQPGQTLLDELGAESIDLLDMLFRLERKTGVKIKAAELADYVQGGIPEAEFGDGQGKVSGRGLAHLKTVMPQVDVEALAGRLEPEKVITLFTVQNLADYVSLRTAAVPR
ncbi:MAG: acyl carrier protein [Chloroflexota bacterium]